MDVIKLYLDRLKDTQSDFQTLTYENGKPFVDAQDSVVITGYPYIDSDFINTLNQCAQGRGLYIRFRIENGYNELHIATYRNASKKRQVCLYLLFLLSGVWGLCISAPWKYIVLH